MKKYIVSVLIFGHSFNFSMEQPEDRPLSVEQIVFMAYINEGQIEKRHQDIRTFIDSDEQTYPVYTIFHQSVFTEAVKLTSPYHQLLESTLETLSQTTPLSFRVQLTDRVQCTIAPLLDSSNKYSFSFTAICHKNEIRHLIN